METTPAASLDTDKDSGNRTVDARSEGIDPDHPLRGPENGDILIF